ncbi:MAG: hypothetical protein KGS72_14225 [Cyanobacteria bacterium REEB67]|nr:hypothetical protein [Cyanobacteria bacterium REEB67]
MADETVPPAGSVVKFEKPQNSARPDSQSAVRGRGRKRERSPAPPPLSASIYPGSSGDGMDGNWGLTVGQHLICKIVARERQGYAVIVEGGMPGFLKTPDTLKLGKKVTAEFICVMDNRVLLAALPDGLHGAGVRSFGMLEELPQGGEVVQLFAKKDESE